MSAQQHEELRRLIALVETTQDAVAFIDGHGTLTRFNQSAERMFGYSSTEVLGQNVKLLMPEPHASQHDDYLRRYQATGEAKAIGKIRSVQARRKNGEVFPIELSVTELPTEGGPEYAAFIRDISLTVELQAELSEKKRLAAVGTTAATLAHEIGNPLNNLRLQTQLLERRLRKQEVSDESVWNGLGLISGEIQRLGGLLEEFRMLSRRQKIRLSTTDLGELVRTVCQEHADEMAKRGIFIDLKVDPLPSVRADPAKLRQVLLNLLKNSAEALEPFQPMGDKRIWVTARSDGEEIAIRVVDNGPGISTERDIFEPFITTKEMGTGLGLPVARAIASSHGGALTHSSPEDGGTEFTLSLPVGPDPRGQQDKA